MKVNKYYLTYRFLNASVHAMIMRDEVEVYSIDLCRMLKISTEKPWKLQKIDYDLFEMNEDNGMLTLCLQSGVMTVKLTLFINNDGLLEFEAEWENTSDEDIANVMLGVEIPMKLADADRIVIPGVCYDDGINENGILKSSVMGSRGYIAEEHKYPMPFVSIQNYKKSGDNSIALFSCPSKCQANEEFDSEWSLGVTTHGDDIKLVLLSGGVMYQGEKNTMLCAKDTAHKSDRGYFVFKSTQKVSKRFMLSVFHAEKENTTLGRLAGTGYYIY